jgi:O-antigen/teichoic acid export membrane protein
MEAFGLIGFFATLQTLFAILDIGLTPTINREVARCRATGDLTDARNLLHTLATLYWCMAVLIVMVMLPLSPVVAVQWVNGTHLSSTTISEAVFLMGLVIAARWPLGIYVGALMGAERLTWVSIISIVMVTLGNVGALLVLAFWSPTLEAFFLWQALIGLLHVAIVRRAAWRALGRQSIRFDKGGLLRIWRFSIGMGVTAILSVIFLQSDKIVLSRIVTLEEFGRYTLAGLVARIIYLVVTPTFNVIYPQMTSLIAVGDRPSLAALFKTGTRLLMAVIFPVAAYISVFARQFVSLWIADPEIARSIAPVVQLILLGTALNSAMIFPYALQLAAGKSHIPAIICGILIVIFVPLVAYMGATYGIVGAAAAWAILNSLYVFVGTWFTNRFVLPGIAPSWLLRDVGIPFAIAGLVVVGGGTLILEAGLGIWIELAAGAVLTLLATFLTIAPSRRLVTGARHILHRQPPALDQSL